VSVVDDNTGFSVWKRDGTGGTPSAISETDVFLQGTGACSIKVSNQGIALAYATSSLDLSASGTHVYIWVNMLAGGLMATRASNGLCIILSSDGTLSSGSNYSMWAVDGADTYPGGWVRYVIDISKTRSAGVGTLNLASVEYIGMYCDTRPNVAKFDNLVIDRIDYAVAGTGLSVYGTSTTDELFQDILDADEGTIANKYGVVTSKEGIIYVRGTIALGDDVGVNAATLTDIDKVVVFESPQYYNGSDVVDAVSTAFQQLKLVGNGTGATSVTFGKKVGSGDTASGRNGLILIQSGIDVTIDFDDGNVDTANIYGTTLQAVTGTISWGTNTAHECLGNSVSGCEQFNTGSVIVRNTNFVNTASSVGATIWGTGTDIVNCSFIANGDAIEMTSTTNQDYDGLNFSGNTFDTHLNNGGTDIDISKTNGSNPTTQRSTGGGTITYVGAAVTMLVTATEQDGTVIQNCRVHLEAVDPGPFPDGDVVVIVNSGTTATVTHTTHGMSSGDKVVIRAASHDENNGVFTITVTGVSEYTYIMGSAPGSSPTGTITSTFVLISALTDVNGEASMSRVFPSNQDFTGRSRKSTSAPYFKNSPLNGTVDSVTGGSATAVMISDD
jgi:hypothetical protein